MSAPETTKHRSIRVAPAAAGFAAALCAILVFGWIANAVFRGQTEAFDAAIRGHVHAWASPALTRVMETFTFLGSTLWLLGLVVVVSVILWRLGHGRLAILLCSGAAGGEVLLEILKRVFQRPRPAPFFGLTAPHSWSFPSGHALNSFCVYVLAAALVSREVRSPAARMLCWIAAVIMAVMPGISRIYLGVHYPSDVLGGYIAATAWLCGLLVATERKRRG